VAASAAPFDAAATGCEVAAIVSEVAFSEEAEAISGPRKKLEMMEDVSVLFLPSFFLVIFRD
jgi:hypothetical protein